MTVNRHRDTYSAPSPAFREDGARCFLANRPRVGSVTPKVGGEGLIRIKQASLIRN